MALVEGTNCGFVAVAPDADPTDLSLTADGDAHVAKFTSPSGAATITEIGWYCSSESEETNFEMGVYAADGAVVPGEAGTLIHSDVTNAKGTSIGWKRVTGLNWAISPETAYWLAVQIDATLTDTTIDRTTGGFYGRDQVGAAALPDPFGGGAILDNDATVAVYAVWESAVGGGVSFGGVYGKTLSGSIGGRGV